WNGPLSLTLTSRTICCWANANGTSTLSPETWENAVVAMNAMARTKVDRLILLHAKGGDWVDAHGSPGRNPAGKGRYHQQHHGSSGYRAPIVGRDAVELRR